MKTIDQITDAEKLFSYERTPCFGFCQTYQVTVLPDGRAVYVGRQYVPILDTTELTIPEKTLTRVKAILKHPDYVNYVLEEPEHQITDIPGLNFSDYTNERDYELAMVIPPAIEKITELIDQVLTDEQLIYDRETYPTIREEILVELQSGTDPNSLKGDDYYEIEYQKEVGAGIHLYTITYPILRKEDALQAVTQKKGVRAAQINHRLRRR